MSTIDEDDATDWRFDLFVYFIVIFYVTVGIYMCKELWPMVKDIWRSYYPERPPQPLEKKTN